VKEFGAKLTGVEYARRVGSYAVIIKDKRVGVIKSGVFDKYFLVGGGIEKGENELDALHREAIEEIGIQITIEEKIGAATEFFYAETDRQYIAKECNFYRVRLQDKITEKAENKLIWIGRNEFDEIYHKCHQWIVKKELNS
jgi:8-oxo-dGTP diphosphatase